MRNCQDSGDDLLEAFHVWVTTSVRAWRLSRVVRTLRTGANTTVKWIDQPLLDDRRQGRVPRIALRCTHRNLAVAELQQGLDKEDGVLALSTIESNGVVDPLRVLSCWRGAPLELHL